MLLFQKSRYVLVTGIQIKAQRSVRATVSTKLNNDTTRLKDSLFKKGRKCVFESSLIEDKVVLILEKTKR